MEFIPVKLEFPTDDIQCQFEILDYSSDDDIIT